MRKAAAERYRDIDFSGARRGPVVRPEPGKTKISIRLDNVVLDHFRALVEKAGGGNYQTLINEACWSTFTAVRPSTRFARWCERSSRPTVAAGSRGSPSTGLDLALLAEAGERASVGEVLVDRRDCDGENSWSRGVVVPGSVPPAGHAISSEPGAARDWFATPRSSRRSRSVRSIMWRSFAQTKGPRVTEKMFRRHFQAE
jgi:uncharacterized protein (DUF4415 family)